MSTAIVKGETRPDDDDVVAVVPDLPISIIADILSRLSVDDVASCKSVGKSWYKLLKDPYFTRLHFTTSSQHTTTNNILLWKVGDDHAFFGDSRDIGRSLYLISKNIQEDGKWKSFTISPEDPNVNIWGLTQASCNGLLCLSTPYFYEEGPNLVYNLLTKEAIPLPQLNFHPDYAKWEWYKSALGFDPIYNKYKLVLSYKRYCHLNYTWGMTAAILTLGETSWRTLQFPHDLETAILDQEPLFFNGAFHWVIAKHHNFEDTSRLDRILTLDITTENFQIINFSLSVQIPYEYLKPMQLENSLAFAYLKDNNHLLGPPSLDVWKIQGANADGTCLYKHRTFNVQVEDCSLIDMRGFRLLGAFHNGVFLFKAFQNRKMGKQLHNHLVLYDPQKDQGSVIEISGVPKSFNAHIFSPSFISPTL